MKNRKLQVWLPMLLGIVMALGMLVGFQLAAGSGRTGGKGRITRSGVQEVLDLLEYKYVDSVKVDTLQQDAIEAIISHLDPHTVYIPPSELAETNADLHGEFSGIGVEYLMINDTLNVVYVVEKGPSAEAGVLAGDQIIKVGNENITGKKIRGTDLRKLLRGPFNTKVQVSIFRDGKEKQVTITRGNIPLPSVDAYYMASPTIGYIRVNKFSETTYKEFMDAATSLQKQGMKKLILDVRGNPGGILSEATNIADELLADGRQLVSTKGLHIKNATIHSEKPGLFEDGPLVILQDELSASASEVLAGALQDNDRGTIVGRRSFGKGLVQEQFTLSNGGALRITVARYFTPTGRSIQKPFNGDREAYMEEIIDRLHQPDSTATQTPKSKVFTTPKGKKVFGGGGISPDELVPFDSVRIPASAINLFNNNILGDFSFQVFRENQKRIRGYKNLQEFSKSFSLPAGTWDAFLATARKDSVQFGEVPATTRQELELRLKANIARYIWRNTGYIQIMQPSDRILQKGLMLIEKQ